MITSFSNPKLKRVRELMERARSRKKAGAFVIEGSRMFREVPRELLQEVYVSEGFHGANPEIEGEVVEDSVFKRLSDTKTPQGIIAVVKQPGFDIQGIFERESGLFLILEGIQDPGNLGTIMRTAEAAGAALMIMDADTADVFSPKVVRATMGAVFRLPFIYSNDLKSSIIDIKKKGVSIYAADLNGTEFFNDAEYDKKSAFLIGNEGNGLKAETVELADKRLKIPMKGETESLNAAVAAALLMYGYACQRGF